MKTLILFSLLILPALTSAKILSKYETTVKLPATSRSWNWTCHTSLTQRVEESQRDYKGELKDVYWDSTSSTERSTDGGKEISFKSEPRINQYHARPRLYAEVTESCSQDYTTHNEKGEKVTATRNASITWKCEIRGGNMPQDINESKSYGCRKDGGAGAWKIDGHWDDQTAKDMIVKRNRNLEIDMTLKKVDKVFKDYFGSCEGKSDAQAIQLNLDQGVQGRLMESAFHFYISIDGGKELDLKRPSGLLSDDIKYCPSTPHAPVHVSVRIVKKGWIWDAKYTSDSAELDKPESYAELKHTRKTLFGNPGFQSTITVQRKPFLEQPQNPAPASGGGASATW